MRIIRKNFYLPFYFNRGRFYRLPSVLVCCIGLHTCRPGKGEHGQNRNGYQDHHGDNRNQFDSKTHKILLVITINNKLPISANILFTFYPAYSNQQYVVIPASSWYAGTDSCGAVPITTAAAMAIGMTLNLTFILFLRCRLPVTK
jgi:hypothetical protein